MAERKVEIVLPSQRLYIRLESWSCLSGRSVLEAVCSTGIGHPFFSSYLGRMVDGVTPVGKYKITEILETDDPHGPYGPYVLCLNKGNKAIHGTDKPEELGKPVTGGCIRISNSDISVFVKYSLITVGTRVFIFDDKSKIYSDTVKGPFDKIPNLLYI